MDISEYPRIKVFTDRGREQATVSVPYVDKDRIREASGRTTKPNGAIQELAADSIFDRTVVKANGHKIKMASFVLPNVEAGDVFEYYWRAKNVLYTHERIEVQADIPSERVRIVFKNKVARMQLHWVYIDLPEPERHQSDETSLEFANLPGFHKEPLMPPEDMSHGWILFMCRGFFQDAYTEAFSGLWKKQGKGGGNTVIRLFGLAGYEGCAEGGIVANQLVLKPESVIVFENSEVADTSTLYRLIGVIKDARIGDGFTRGAHHHLPLPVREPLFVLATSRLHPEMAPLEGDRERTAKLFELMKNGRPDIVWDCGNIFELTNIVVCP